MNYTRYFRLAPAVLSAALLQSFTLGYAQAPSPGTAPVAAPSSDTTPPVEITAPTATPSAVINDGESPGGDPVKPKPRKKGSDTFKGRIDPTKHRPDPGEPEELGALGETLIVQRDTFLGDVDNLRAQAERQVADIHKQINGMRGLFSTGTNRRTMVLPTGTTDPKTLAQTHEDLVVMHRLLTKALSSKSNTKEFGFRFNSDDRQVDAMYLEGYGAVFLLNVDYPLVEPPKREKPAPEAEPKDPTWEEERRSARGDDTGKAFFADDSGKTFFSGNEGGEERPAVPDFNPDRVNRLQNRMIEALKHANNIRNLKPDDDVIVVVAGRSQPHFVAFGRTQATVLAGEASVIAPTPSRANRQPSVLAALPTPPVAGREYPAEGGMALIASDRGSQSALVLRVKKSAVDSLAAGKLDANGFRNSVIITAQPSETPTKDQSK